MIVRNYAQFGGRHCETGALRNVLAHYGVAAPHTGKPFSEEMLLGIGGGIGCSYQVFEVEDDAIFFPGCRHGEPKTLMIEEICGRLGLGSSLCETASGARAAADLEAVLCAGRPAPVWVDMALLPYLAIPEKGHFGGHVIVVYGIDDGSGDVLIADRAARGVRAGAADFAAARASKCKPFPPHHKMLEIVEPEEPVQVQTLERAVVRGIGDCWRQLLQGPVQNIGLGALEKWAELVVNDKNAKGWPRVFRTPASLYGALASTYTFIEASGTGGGAFRLMYADFLDEAAEVLGQKALRKVAAQYRRCARLWSDVARAALPDDVPDLRAARELLAEKNRIFEAQAEGALERMHAINLELEKILARARAAFPGDAARVLGGLSDALVRVHAAELDAVRLLQACVR